MITKIKGLLLSVGDDALTLAVEAYEYQIYIPDFARRQLPLFDPYEQVELPLDPGNGA